MEMELLGPELWASVLSELVFFPHKAAAPWNCSAQTNWLWLAKKKQRKWHCRLGAAPDSTSPRELTLQGEGWAKGSFSAILSLSPGLCGLLWRLPYWDGASPSSCFLCSWGVHRIQYLFTLWLLLLSRLSLFSFLVNLFFHLYLLTFISPYWWKVSS